MRASAWCACVTSFSTEAGDELDLPIGRRPYRGFAGLSNCCAPRAGEVFMTATGTFQILFYLAVLVALFKPLGAFMARVCEGNPGGLDRVFGFVAPFIYGVCRTKRAKA
jgi:hypothetical protein